MHCHEILGVRESASWEDIECAFSEKCTRLTSNKDVLGIVPYERKIQELKTAKKECLEWKDKSFSARTLSRVSEYSSQVTSSNRVNECCIGPFSCVDYFCGYICCGNVGSHDYGFIAACCCDESSLNYTPTIWCDVVLYAGLVWLWFSDRKEKKKAEEAEIRKRQAERARSENAQLEEKLRQCLATQKNIQEQLQEEEKTGKTLAAFISFFSSLGDVDGQTVTENQKLRIQGKRASLEKSREKERELRDKIKNNQRIIDAGNR